MEIEDDGKCHIPISHLEGPMSSGIQSSVGIRGQVSFKPGAKLYLINAFI